MDVLPVDELTTVAPHDAVILGSGVYMGRWLEPAQRFTDRFATDLSARPVWLFSSGPIGDPPKPAGETGDVVGLVEATHARGHRVFAGSLDMHELGIGERAFSAAVRAPEGDFRPWDDIESWANEIAGELKAAVPG